MLDISSRPPRILWRKALTYGGATPLVAPPTGGVIALLVEEHRSALGLIDADGGTPRRLTTEVSDAVVPTWSHDGRWIYFSGDQGTGREIWRAPASGGASERLTRGAGGPFACESADGKQLLFQPKEADSPLMAMALTGGEARQLVACVWWSAFGASPKGCITCRAIPAPIRPSMSWIWQPVGTGASAGSRNSPSARWV